MKKIFSVSRVLFQVFSTGFVLFCIFMFFALLDNNEADTVNMIVLFVIQPVYGLLVIAVTLLICGVAGLPVRLNSKINEWWKARPYISIAGIVAGIVLLLLSLNSHFSMEETVTINEEKVVKEIPNISMAITGWFLTAFSLLHFYPESLLRYAKKKLKIAPAWDE